MNSKKFIIPTVILTVLLLMGGYWWVGANGLQPVQLSEQTKLEIAEPTSFDWGKISYSGEKAKKSFTLKNTGQATLKLYNVRTSCHCTKARVLINGQTSPDFGMSGQSSWVGEVLSGQEAQVEVVFDQTYHGPQALGPINRFVSIKTNDQSLPELTLTLTGTVIKS